MIFDKRHLTEGTLKSSHSNWWRSKMFEKLEIISAYAPEDFVIFLSPPGYLFGLETFHFSTMFSWRPGDCETFHFSTMSPGDLVAGRAFTSQPCLLETWWAWRSFHFSTMSPGDLVAGRGFHFSTMSLFFSTRVLLKIFYSVDTSSLSTSGGVLYVEPSSSISTYSL